MRVLVFSQYFAPEVTASRVRVQAFAQGLAERGHEVEVICEVPNHPDGVVHRGYGDALLVDRRQLDGYEVAYVRVRTSAVKSTRNRLLLYGTYAASAAIVGIGSRRPDVILASSPPLPVGAAAALVAKRHRVPWVFDVRDLWPEAAVVLGELRGNRTIAAAERLERRLYRSAAAIITVTRPFVEVIAAQVDRRKVNLLANGTTRLWMDAGAAEADRRGAAFPDDVFTWMYAGNLGIAQGLATAIEAARLLGDGFRLVLLGGGPQKEKLVAASAALAPGAVEFRDTVQPAEAARQLRAADALLVSLDAQPELAKFVPSKLFDYCALGRPVIVAASGEAPRLASEAEAAITVAPGDSRALADAVRGLRDEPAVGERLGRAGRTFAAGHLRENQIAQLEDLLARAAS